MDPASEQSKCDPKEASKEPRNKAESSPQPQTQSQTTKWFSRLTTELYSQAAKVSPQLWSDDDDSDPDSSDLLLLTRLDLANAELRRDPRTVVVVNGDVCGDVDVLRVLARTRQMGLDVVFWKGVVEMWREGRGLGDLEVIDLELESMDEEGLEVLTMGDDLRRFSSTLSLDDEPTLTTNEDELILEILPMTDEDGLELVAITNDEHDDLLELSPIDRVETLVLEPLLMANEETLNHEFPQVINPLKSNFGEKPHPTNYLNPKPKLHISIIERLRSSPIPATLRIQVWSILANIPPHIKHLYDTLKQRPSKSTGLIKKDVGRTFPHHAMFRDARGQGRLEEVLRVFSVYDLEVGYCQGISFWVGGLLMQGVDEVMSFGLLVALMGGETGVRRMFVPSMIGLHIAIFQHAAFLTRVAPSLALHFKNIQVNPTMYLSQWFLTLFSIVFPPAFVARLYDLVFGEGARITMMRLSIAILVRFQVRLKGMDLEGVLGFLKGGVVDAYEGDVEEMISDLVGMRHVIFVEAMDNLEVEFERGDKNVL